MELRDLAYFETIAELEHVGAAAIKLNRSQPALSASVRRLEQFCGAELFKRSGRGIRLTAAGEAMLQWARRLRLDAMDARREVHDLGRGITGHIRMGAIPTAANYLIPNALAQLMVQAPEVTLSATVGLPVALAERLRAGELDVIVVSENSADSDLHSQRLAEDSFVTVAKSTHPLFKAVERDKWLHLGDLAEFAWVLQQPGSTTRDWIDHEFDRQGFSRPRVHIESDMLVVLPGLMAGDGFLGFISRLQLERSGMAMGLRELPVAGLNMRRYLAAKRRKAGYVPPSVQLFIRLLEEAGATMNVANYSAHLKRGARNPASKKGTK